MELLTRDEFRRGVFERDKGKCVICGGEAKDAHHIMERRLFENGGYYLNNGASLCEEHHILAEQTLLSCDSIRYAAGIEKVVIPSHLYDDNEYDKWGNIIINNLRYRGELFYDPSVQKILKEGGVLYLFTELVKYPRTYHLPWSPGFTKDDRVLMDVSQFEGKRVIVTTKMDGENTTMYPHYIHARSLESSYHLSRTWVKGLHARIAHEIPAGWRICGENLFAKHSIYYRELPSYFMVFSIWDDKNNCLSWDETVEYAQILGLQTVPVLYDGIWNEEVIKSLWVPDDGINDMEGYVVRIADSFPYGAFRHSVAKYVRKNHVQTHNWMYQEVVKNSLKRGC